MFCWKLVTKIFPIRTSINVLKIMCHQPVSTPLQKPQNLTSHIQNRRISKTHVQNQARIAVCRLVLSSLAHFEPIFYWLLDWRFISHVQLPEVIDCDQKKARSAILEHWSNAPLTTPSFDLLWTITINAAWYWWRKTPERKVLTDDVMKVKWHEHCGKGMGYNSSW